MLSIQHYVDCLFTGIILIYVRLLHYLKLLFYGKYIAYCITFAH